MEAKHKNKIKILLSLLEFYGVDDYAHNKLTEKDYIKIEKDILETFKIEKNIDNKHEETCEYLAGNNITPYLQRK